jgi:hypothetical protein
MPGVPPVPIPNTAVKPRAANGSWTLGPARVGRCQVYGPVLRKKNRAFLFLALGEIPAHPSLSLRIQIRQPAFISASFWETAFWGRIARCRFRSCRNCSRLFGHATTTVPPFQLRKKRCDYEQRTDTESKKRPEPCTSKTNAGFSVSCAHSNPVVVTSVGCSLYSPRAAKLDSMSAGRRAASAKATASSPTCCRIQREDSSSC